MKEKYLTVKDASSLTTLSPSTIYSYVHYKVIPYAKIGARIVFEENRLRQWLKSKEKKMVKRD
ncbi:MAG: helix-turn-helix domain-containing protein [Treponema sp.]|jgi:excisionase family DNA binding protein|nr:helix-turn-helix domain-containing protein [Treponema sp.]